MLSIDALNLSQKVYNFLNKIPEGEIWYIRSVQTINRITLENYPLENLDTIRDKILLTSGDVVFDISNAAMSVEPFTNFKKRKRATNKLNTTDPQYGLCLKTCNSDYIIVTGKHGVDRGHKRN